MDSYIMIIIADILLAVDFAFQKKYQKTAGTSVKAGVSYNALLGVLSAVIFFVMNKFRIHITAFSLLMAVAFATLIMLYVFIGFKIMKKGNMALYTLFLMSGGMTVPFVWGVIFWQEVISLWRVAGLIFIIAAIILSNTGAKKPDKNQMFLCILVFFMNGFASVIAKTHQLSDASKLVTSSDFVILVNASKAVICSVALLFMGAKGKNTASEKLPMKPVVIISALSAVAGGLSYYLQLIGAVSVPATVLYPLITGGTVILTSLTGMIVYKEKIAPMQWVGIGICLLGTLMFL